MTFSMESISVLNPKLTHGSMPLKKVPMIPGPLQSLKFEPLLRNRVCRVSAVYNGVSPKGLGASGFRTLNPRSSRTPLIVAFTAPHEESHREIEVEKENDEPHIGSEESQEAWKQALDTFREQASKIQSVSQEAYEIYSKKAIIILKDTSEQLKIQADKARHDLSVAAKEISEEGKEYLIIASDNSPEDVKEIVQTFTSPTDDISEISEVRDFYVGIPYGLILSLGGFLSFMVSGSIAAIRFGVILGGVLLALSIASLKSYKRDKPSPLALKGQLAIASILFLRELSLVSKGSSLVTYFTALISGAVMAFYIYRLVLERKDQKGTNLEGGAEN
ncbi:hypothetical protein L6164_002494 [Bauhinia variegata]|uniref:Uncharacterized protein n=1 Tax=Bauhinia variegata TaxID=167791 RepID=A0ACB9Q3U3_BAUVA|nr:hypothetical protein L6164_002494 [Bauhinia variegata]